MSNTGAGPRPQTQKCPAGLAILFLPVIKPQHTVFNRDVPF